MLIAFFIILIDLIGFSIMVPIFAFYALNMGASPAVATMLMSLYVIAQFMTAPLLGQLSDHHGRRPVLMLSMLGASLGYILLANAGALWLVALARIISGAMAGNIAAAQAYMTDVSAPEERAKAMGLIGAAFGLSFLIGPVIGSYLAGDSFADANLSLPAYVSAALSFAAFIGVALFLPESLGRQHRQALRAPASKKRLVEFRQVSARPNIRLMLLCGFIFNIGAGLFEALFPIWASGHGTNIVALQASEFPFLGSGPQGLVPFLLLGGSVMVVVQGGLVGPLSKRFGEMQLLRAATVMYALGMIGLTLAADFQLLLLAYGAMACISAATALVMTCLQSLVSMQASETERGMVMGVFSSAGTIGRATGTVLTGLILTYVYVHASYYLAAATALLVLGIATALRRQLNP